MRPPPPPEEISQLMQFIAEKGKNVKSPMNLKELCRQFKSESGSSMSIETVKSRIILYRLKIHEMNEFDIETKVKMIYALSAPIDAGFLSELKKVADVEMDDKQRIIHYEQKDGELKLSGKHSRVPKKMGEQRNRDMIQFLAEKSKTTDTPIADKVLLREFKEKSGYTDSIGSLDQRYVRVKEKIYQSTGIDRNTKIKMMFISNLKLSDETLKELREDAHVEVDEEGRITKYKSKDGSLELEGKHGLSTIKKSFYSNRWQTISQKANENESEEDDDKDTNCQKDKEKTRIDLVRFLIERTKNATSPLSIKQLAEDYKKEFKSSEPLGTTESRIKRFRQRLRETSQFDMSTKVKILFALSAPIDDDLLKELRKDAIVELDERLKIKKYEANDGSLTLEGVPGGWPRRRAVTANDKKSGVFNDLSESEEDDDEEEEVSIETFGSDEEGDEYTVDSVKSNQASISLPKRRSQRIRKPKRAKISCSSSEAEDDDREESETSDNDIAMDTETNDIDNGGDDVDRLSYHYYNERDSDMNNADYGEDDYNYDPLRYHYHDTEVMDHIPVDTKPENLIEVKTEVPEERSNLEYDLIEPKIEECTREVKQEAEENEEGTSTTSSPSAIY